MLCGAADEREGNVRRLICAGERTNEMAVPAQETLCHIRKIVDDTRSNVLGNIRVHLIRRFMGASFLSFIFNVVRQATFFHGVLYHSSR